MVLPKTTLIYSGIYNKQFNKKFRKKDLEKLKKKRFRFERLYQKHIKDVLKLIEKHSERWKKEFIPIYVVFNKSSFSEPLTLKYRPNEKLMFVVLAHEVLHNNISKKFRNSKILHEYMEPILNKVILSLRTDLSKELSEFNRIIQNKYT